MRIHECQCQACDCRRDVWCRQPAKCGQSQVLHTCGYCPTECGITSEEITARAFKRAERR